eukprot:CAMPEP_0115719236 /NCGR_PEP_ID=MMETSP0272-20121206/77868_1 /TAXON_ID=71861 /ORGANISM="Scrippsiella trochoidea, Strain CCMP3099" /LENGTH=473 /DNA_ID=CAMNT_0003161841 /DNA_START=108 /DNA_END=1526 /DNA_ORIENTATION=+
MASGDFSALGSFAGMTAAPMMNLAGLGAMGAAAAPSMGLPCATLSGGPPGRPNGTELPSNQPITGTVKAWMDDKGFGFVTPTMGGPDVFVHRNQLSDGQSLAQGSTVTVECRFNPQRAKYEATTCSGASAAPSSAAAVLQLVATSASDGQSMVQGSTVTFECRFNPQRAKYEATTCSGASSTPTPASGGAQGPSHVSTLASPVGQGVPSMGQDKLFVAGLPMDFTEDRIRALFGQYGTVTLVKVLPDQPGRNDRAALVRFMDPRQAQWMVENMHGNIPVGMASPLICRYATAGPGGGPRFGGGGGFGKGGAPSITTENRFSPYGAAPGAAVVPALGSLGTAAAQPGALQVAGTQLSDSSVSAALAQLLGAGAATATAPAPAAGLPMGLDAASLLAGAAAVPATAPGTAALTGSIALPGLPDAVATAAAGAIAGTSTASVVGGTMPHVDLTAVAAIGAPSTVAMSTAAAAQLPA